MASVGKKNMIISFSGGRTSAFMTQWLLKNKSEEYNFYIVFSNTGREHESTLKFINECDKHFGFNVHWIEPVTNPKFGVGIRAKKVTFETANRDGQPFEDIIKKYSIPNRTSPFCSEYMKKNAIRAYCRDFLGFKKVAEYQTAIGIRVDEFDRQSENKAKENLIYPLISMIPTRKSDVNKFWMNMPFDLELKSYEGNCKTCWKKSLRKLLTIAKENPEWFEWDAEMERKYENYIPESRKDNENIKPPLRFHRQNLTANQILEMSKQDFEPARNENFDVIEYEQTTLFGHDLDTSNGCEESCEAF
jgi:predicted phosphoadenosine phosphosulfate sulfurtransferase